MKFWPSLMKFLKIFSLTFFSPILMDLLWKNTFLSQKETIKHQEFTYSLINWSRFTTEKLILILSVWCLKKRISSGTIFIKSSKSVQRPKISFWLSFCKWANKTLINLQKLIRRLSINVPNQLNILKTLLSFWENCLRRIDLHSKNQSWTFLRTSYHFIQTWCKFLLFTCMKNAISEVYKDAGYWKNRNSLTFTWPKFYWRKLTLLQLMRLT